MKKFIVIILCVCFCFIGVGCESETAIKAAHISDMTGALSTDYAVKVTLDKDDRVNEKFVDIQLKSSLDEQILKFGEELKDSYTICLPKKDFWYNLTYLISQTNGASGEEKYLSYEDFGTRVFMFSANNDVDITFRTVAGETTKNETTGEEILVLSESISAEVTINVKKHIEK